jgi:mRNA interferase YafQ
MKEASWTGPFKKDLKRLIKRGYKLQKLHQVLSTLQQNENLPPSARAHLLQGEWAGYWECHIEPDWLLIYKIIGNTLLLARTGTHADLFE